MEIFKLDILKKDGIDIKYNSLNNVQIIQIMKDIESQFGNFILNDKVTFEKIRDTFFQKKIELSTINKEDGFKNLCSLFNIELKEKENVFILWDKQNVDAFLMSDLYYYWNYVWYGPSDECCIIYYPNNGILLMINDYGIIYW